VPSAPQVHIAAGDSTGRSAATSSAAAGLKSAKASASTIAPAIQRLRPKVARWPGTLNRSPVVM
jgi:hypothetical protein